MELRDIFRVMWKHKVLFGLSLIVGIAMGFLSYGARAGPVYKSSKLLLIDQPGFAIGKAGNDTAGPYVYDRTVKLAGAYSRLMTSPRVMSMVERELGGELKAQIGAGALRDAPIIKIRASAPSRSEARAAVNAVASTFKDYLVGTQNASGVPKDERIVIRSLGPASRPVAQASGGLQVVFLSFLAPVFAFVMASLMYENLKRENGSRDREA